MKATCKGHGSVSARPSTADKVPGNGPLCYSSQVKGPGINSKPTTTKPVLTVVPTPDGTEPFTGSPDEASSVN